MRQVAARHRACLVAWVIVVVATSTARAADDYQTLIDGGVREYAGGNFVEARTLFEQAHAREPSARTWRALGLCAYELKQYGQAIDELSSALSDVRRPLTPELANAVRATLERARRYVGELRLELTPPETRVVIDGSAREGRRFSLDAGEHLVALSAPGHRSRDLHVTIVGLQTKSLEIALTPLESTPPLQLTTADVTTGAPLDAPVNPPVDEGPALTERWWFWTAIAVVAAGAAAGAFAIANSGDDSAGAGSSGVTLRGK